MFETLTERDLRALMAVVEDGRRAEPTEGLPWAVLDGLAGLVACDRIGFLEGDLIHGRLLLCQWVDTLTKLRNPSRCAGFDESGHGLHAAFPTAPGHFRRLSLWRDTGSDFTERDRLVVQLLRPHLYEIFLDTRQHCRSIPRLSPREREVLELADQGLGNADIARRLSISVATVRKHLEHVYDRTGARTRTAAAALTMINRNRAFPPFDPTTATAG